MTKKSFFFFFVYFNNRNSMKKLVLHLSINWKKKFENLSVYKLFTKIQNILKIIISLKNCWYFRYSIQFSNLFDCSILNIIKTRAIEPKWWLRPLHPPASWFRPILLSELWGHPPDSWLHTLKKTFCFLYNKIDTRNKTIGI